MIESTAAIGIHSGKFKKGLQPKSAGNLSFPHLSAIKSAHRPMAVKPPPAIFDSYKAVKKTDGQYPWGMFLNDTWGDCADAMVMHELMYLSANANTQLVLTDDTAEKLYEEQGGFNPDAGPSGSNPTDQGSNLVDLLKFRMNTGVLMPDGTRHKIVAAFEIDPRNMEDVNECISTCGGIETGIDCYDAFMEVPPGGMFRIPLFARPEGGHAIPQGKYDPDNLYPISWGNQYGMSRHTFQKITTQAFVVITEEYVQVNGTLPCGMTLQQAHDIMVASGMKTV